MNDNYLQKIFSNLETILPAEWQKVVFYAGYTKGSYSMKYYTDYGDGYVDCFSDKNVKKADVINVFIAINRIISRERDSLEDKKRWNVMSMLVDNAGKIKTEFDYSDISENPIEYEKEWKKKYIK